MPQELGGDMERSPSRLTWRGRSPDFTVTRAIRFMVSFAPPAAPSSHLTLPIRLALSPGASTQPGPSLDNTTWLAVGSPVSYALQTELLLCSRTQTPSTEPTPKAASTRLGQSRDGTQTRIMCRT